MDLVFGVGLALAKRTALPSDCTSVVFSVAAVLATAAGSPGEEHWAHQHRKEGRRAPAGVLSWVIGTPHEPEEPARLFAPLR